ncbi:carbohydrate-binding protein, partial [Hymenobacter terrenus]|uniref:carbohydrate-binding protein n=1 Tax=Hymenobacter terrenus TaxID=1629124 RepID=UPI000B055C8F
TGPTTPPSATLGRIQAENFTAQSGVQAENTSDTGGGQNIGFVEAGDWLDYAVTVPTAGTYTFTYRVASQTGGGKITLRLGSTDLHTVTVNSTGSWQSWTTVSATATLAAGPQTLRLFATAAGWNLNWFEAAIPAATPQARVATSATKLSAAARPTLFPNPTTGSVHLQAAPGQLPAAPEQTLELRSAQGQLLQVLPATTTEVDLADRPAGLYLLRTQDGQTLRVIKK